MLCAHDFQTCWALFYSFFSTQSIQENVENFSGGVSSGVREGYNIGAWSNWHVLLKFLKCSINVNESIQLFNWRLGLFLWSSSSNCCEQSKVLSRGTHRQPGNCWTNKSDVALILTLILFPRKRIRTWRRQMWMRSENVWPRSRPKHFRPWSLSLSFIVSSD